MAGEVSFDVVSDFDEQELRNALDQVRREVQQRYDFKGVTVDLSSAENRSESATEPTWIVHGHASGRLSGAVADH